MDKTIAYGIGAGSGVVEYHLIRQFAPTKVNTYSAVGGMAALGAVALNVVKNDDIKNILIANGFTLCAITLVQAFTNPTASSVTVGTPRARSSNCPKCNGAASSKSVALRVV